MNCKAKIALSTVLNSIVNIFDKIRVVFMNLSRPITFFNS